MATTPGPRNPMTKEAGAVAASSPASSSTVAALDRENGGRSEEQNAAAAAAVAIIDEKQLASVGIHTDHYDYDYFQRVRRIFNMLDVRNALVSTQYIEACRQCLAAAEKIQPGNPPWKHPSTTSSSLSPSYGDIELGRARKIVDAAVHPQTGRLIFLPLRLSFIVPANVCLDTLMISARGPFQHIVAQLTNQSYNSLHYYANRNESNPQTTRKRVLAFVGASVSACGAAVGIERLAPPRFFRFAPLLAVAAADVANIAITRQDEYRQGIYISRAESHEYIMSDVSEENKKKVNTVNNMESPSGDTDAAETEERERAPQPLRSHIAGRQAVMSTIAARVLAATPILLLPPLIVDGMVRLSPSFRCYQRWLRIPFLMLSLGVVIQGTVPFTFAIFAQQSKVRASSLEPEVLAALNGRDQWVSFNRGL